MLEPAYFLYFQHTVHKMIFTAAFKKRRTFL